MRRSSHLRSQTEARMAGVFATTNGISVPLATLVLFMARGERNARLPFQH